MAISIHIAVRRMKSMSARMVADIEAGNGAFGVCYRRWAMRYLSEMQQRFAKFSRGGGDWAPLKTSTILARMRRPMGRLRVALARGDIDQKTFARRYASAKAKYQKASLQHRGDAAIESHIEKHQKRLVKTLGKLEKAFKRGKLSYAAHQKKRAAAVRAYKRAIKPVAPTRVAILRDTGTLFNALSPSISQAPGALRQKIAFGVRVGYGGPGRHPGSQLTVANLARFHQTGGGKLPKRVILTAPSQRTVAAMRRDFASAVRKYTEAANLLRA